MPYHFRGRAAQRCRSSSRQGARNHQRNFARSSTVVTCTWTPPARTVVLSRKSAPNHVCWQHLWALALEGLGCARCKVTARRLLAAFIISHDCFSWQMLKFVLGWGGPGIARQRSDGLHHPLLSGRETNPLTHAFDIEFAPLKPLLSSNYCQLGRLPRDLPRPERFPHEPAPLESKHLRLADAEASQPFHSQSQPTTRIGSG